jgi:diguanylate cyclase (GGDEF)-like protein
MNPTTAACFVALSLALTLETTASVRRGRPLAAALAAVVAVAGLLVLANGFAGLHWPIDSTIFASKLAANPGHPSRMAPNTALCFVLIGLAALSIGRGTEPAVIAGQILSVLGASIALFAVTGHLYAVTQFYAVPAFIPMALHAACAMLSLAGAMTFMTADRGLFAPIFDPGTAGQSSRALLPAAFLVPLGLGLIWLWGERRGAFSEETGVAVMVVITAFLLALLIWWNSRKILALDRRRAVAEAELLRIATHDHLTGLPNRAFFMERLTARLSLNRRRWDGCFAVLYMDLDGFKLVNDRLGHDAGDQLLRQVADHLRRCARDDDLVARLGGDEFTMLLERVDNPRDAGTVAARIVNGMPRDYGPPGSTVPIGISLGIVVAELRHLTADALLNEADHALYAPKRGGKGRFEFFSAGPAETIPD